MSRRPMLSKREPWCEGVIDLDLYPATKPLIMVSDLSVLFTSRNK